MLISGSSFDQPFTLLAVTCYLVCNIWQQGNLPGAFDSQHKTPLVLSAYPGRPSWEYFAALGQVTPELHRVFIVDILRFINAELAHFPSFAIAVLSAFSVNWHLYISFLKR